jgi:hypothetical protein
MYVRNGLKRASVPAMTYVMQNHHLAVQYTPPTVANLDQILTILRPMQTMHGQIWTIGGDRQMLLRSLPNAGAHLLPEAGATQERTLEAVRCSAWFGAGWAPDFMLPRALPGPPRLSFCLWRVCW